MREFDAIVIGVGGMGSAAVYHLARRGWRVLGLEQYDIPNEMGSSHGVSRMIRLAYHEDPSYVPLLYRAYELWQQLENLAGERLLVSTGCLRGGVGANQLLEGSLATVRQHNLPYRILSGPEVNREWPGYQLPEDAEMLYEQQGGFVLSERCISGPRGGGFGIGRGGARAGGGAGMGTHRRRWRRGNHRQGYLRRPPAGRDRRRVGRQGRAPSRRPRRTGAAGAGLVRAVRPELFPAGVVPVFGLEVAEGRFYGFPSYGIPGFKLGMFNHFRSRWTRIRWPESLTRRTRRVAPVHGSATSRKPPAPRWP